MATPGEPPHRRPSMLFADDTRDPPPSCPPRPRHLNDLGLDQLVEELVVGREHDDLARVMEQPLEDLEEVRYRQEVFKDLEVAENLSVLEQLSAAVTSAREVLRTAAALRHRYQRAAFVLAAAGDYIEALKALAAAFRPLVLSSRALRQVRDHVERHLSSDVFRSLESDTRAAREALGSVAFTMLVDGNRVTVGRYDGEPDYGAQLLAVFARFRDSDGGARRVRYREPLELNHVEQQVLDCVARLFPGPFGLLERHLETHGDFVDATLATFAREAQFYLSYLHHLAPLRAAGMSVCYPELTPHAGDVECEGGVDLVLATKLLREGRLPVENDFHLEPPERVIVVSGPNQGGKTTFARMFGQLHHLAAVGCPVPARRARLQLFDRLLTHFGHEEQPADLVGRLEDDLLRAKAIVDVATARSVVVVNEIFSSATLADAVLLGTELMRALEASGALAVVVSFVEELSRLGPVAVSMVASRDSRGEGGRSYTVVRRPADGRAYARALAEQHGLTYEQLRARVAP